jgi:hypothetical protein
VLVAIERELAALAASGIIAVTAKERTRAAIMFENGFFPVILNI